MDMDRIERIEKKIKGSFDSYELFFLKENEKKFETRNMELSAAEVKEEVGVALRAVRDGRMVFSYSFDDEEEAAHALLANATAILPFLEVDRNAGFPEPSGSYEDPAIYDRSGLSTGEQEKAAILMDMERTILEYDPRIRTTRNCELQETEIHAAIVNSRGVRVEAKKTIYALSAMCVAQDEDEVSWFDWSWGNRLLDLDGPGLGRDIARTAVSLLSSRQLDTGVYNGIHHGPGVLRPSWCPGWFLPRGKPLQEEDAPCRQGGDALFFRAPLYYGLRPCRDRHLPLRRRRCGESNKQGGAERLF